jgi:adenylate cyclase
MFTDIAGYTSLAQKNEALAIELLEEHRRLIRPLFRKHKGREAKTMGDAFLVEFASALDALSCGYEMQSALHERNSSRPADRRIEIKIGIHLGDVIHDKKRDMYGDAVNVASRIEPLAEPGGICVSQQLYDQIRNKFEFPLSSLGKKELKNVELPIEVYKVSLPWTAVTTNGINTMKLFDEHRIAVLPFSNISPNPEDEYFADGMTEELISTLSKIRELKVISRTSVMRYKQTNKSISEMALELEVGTILEGSVRKAGDKLRITVQLIDSSSSGHLWSESYDRELKDVFAIQTDIAREVADALKLQLLPSEIMKIEKEPTKNTEAYSLYLKGRYFWNQMSKNNLFRGAKCFEEAILLDPNYALAYCGLADCYNMLGNGGYISSNETFSKAEPALKKALELDEGLPEAHATLGHLLENKYDWLGSTAEFKRSLELSPSNAAARGMYACNLAELGKFDEALSESSNALELDPVSPLTNYCWEIVRFYAGYYDVTIDHCKKLLKLYPDYEDCYSILACCYFEKSLFSDSTQALMTAVRLSEGDKNLNGYYATLGYVLAKSGNRSEALKILDKFKQGMIEGCYVPADLVALIYTGLGEKDEAFKWFDKALDERNPPTVIQWLKVDPMCDDLRSDPRFDLLLKKLGYAS